MPLIAGVDRQLFYSVTAPDETEALEKASCWYKNSDNTSTFKHTTPTLLTKSPRAKKKNYQYPNCRFIVQIETKGNFTTVRLYG
jgi:hypothetical protein